LSNKAREEIEAESAINFVSIASIWEMALKVSLKKLVLRIPFNQFLDELTNNGFQILPITVEDTLYVSTLPFHHRDPFDSILLSQAITNKLTLISRDAHFRVIRLK
jgi:PIN domain nuclease of toxin-antitoxin system